VFRYVSAACRFLLGYTPENMTGRSWLDFVDPDDRNEVARALRDVATDAGVSKTTARFRRSTGEYAWMESTMWALRDDATREILELQSVCRDVTVQRDIETRLEEQQTFVRQLIDAIPSPIVLQDAAGTVLLANAAGIEQSAVVSGAIVQSERYVRLGTRHRPRHSDSAPGRTARLPHRRARRYA
jgi:PAS domain S-box-containing protein